MQTSALDTHTEQTLLQNINSILKEKGRTSVFVAHRLRTIFDSDKIIVLRGGQVAESGTHSQLIDTGGLYSELWSGKPKDPFPSNPPVPLLIGFVYSARNIASGGYGCGQDEGGH